MPDASTRPDAIHVALQGSVALVRVTGDGSCRVSTALKQFGTAVLERGVGEILMDMTACTGLDSTFMGVLAGLGKRARQRQGRLVLRGLRAEVAQRATALGLDRVVELQAGDDAANDAVAASDLQALPPGDPARDRVINLETSLAAHEELSNLAPANAPLFRDVVAFLREDLQKATGAGNMEQDTNAD